MTHSAPSSIFGIGRRGANTMPPFSVGFAQVEHRLGIVRRRLNLFMLQDVFYWSGSLSTLAAALLVAVALRGRAGWFAIAVWAAVGAITAAIAAAILRVRRRWRSIEDVVRWADREAHLQDRLATLLLDPVRTRASRFSDMLLEQVLAAAPRWDVTALAPRRVPRSLYALVAALLILIATGFFARPPATPLSSTAAAAQHPDTEAVAEAMRRRVQSDAVGGALQAGGSSKRAREAAGSNDEPIRPAAAFSGGEPGEASPRATGQSDGHPSSAGAERRGNGPGVNQEMASRDDAPAPTNPTTEGMAEQLQDAIRHALAASQPADKGSRGGSGRPADENLAPSNSDAREPLARHDTGTNTNQRGDDTSQPSGPTGQQPGTGAAASAGAQSGDATAQLFSQSAAARTAGEESQRLAIKLGAFAAAVAPNQVEPQRRLPPSAAVPLDAISGKRPPTLSDEQVPDAPLQKADVGPQHETVVRRIFTRE